MIVSSMTENKNKKQENRGKSFKERRYYLPLLAC